MYNLNKSNYIVPKIILNLFFKKNLNLNYRFFDKNVFIYLLYFSKKLRNNKIKILIFEWIKNKFKIEQKFNDLKFYFTLHKIFLKKNTHLILNNFNLNFLLSIKAYKGLKLKSWIGSSIRYCSYFFTAYNFAGMNVSYALFSLKKVFLILSVLSSNGLPILFINKYYDESKSRSMQEIAKKCFQSCIHGWIPGSLTNFKKISRYGLSSFFSLRKNKVWNRNALYLSNKNLKNININVLGLNLNVLLVYLFKILKKSLKNVTSIKIFLKQLKKKILFYYFYLILFNFLKKLNKNNKTIFLYLNKNKYKRRMLRKKKRNIIFLKNFYFKNNLKKYKNIKISKKNYILIKFLFLKKIFDNKSLLKIKTLSKFNLKFFNIKRENSWGKKKYFKIKNIKIKYNFFKGYRRYLSILRKYINKKLNVSIKSSLNKNIFSILERKKKKDILDKRVTLFPSVVILLSPTGNPLSLYESKNLRLCSIGILNSNLKDINLSYIIPGNDQDWSSTIGIGSILSLGIKKGLILKKKNFLNKIKYDKNSKKI